HGWLRDARPQRHMGTPGIVMPAPCVQKAPQMVFCKRHEKVQTLASQRPKEAFTDRIGLRSPGRRFQHAQAQVAYAPVQGLEEDAVAVMDEEAEAMIRRYRFAQLLQGPLCRGMRCDIDMEQAAAGVFNDHKDVEETKSCCDSDTKVAGHDRLRMVAHKRCPTLRLAP